jgi:hypothetical protein
MLQHIITNLKVLQSVITHLPHDKPCVQLMEIIQHAEIHFGIHLILKHPG